MAPAIPPLNSPQADPVSATASGREMRSRLLDVATQMFKTRGLAAVTVSAVATAAQAFPSQVTYYFRTKDAMFVEAACREILYVAQRAEKVSRTSSSPSGYLEALTKATLGHAGLSMFLEALVLARHRPALQPLIARTMERLHHEGERAFAKVRAAKGWQVNHSDAVTARRFWALVMGLGLGNEALGATARASQIEACALLAEDFAPTPESVATELRLVSPPKESFNGRRRAR